MKVLYVASEASPFISTGGLGDVMGSLPYAVKKESLNTADTRVVIPLYKSIKCDNNDFDFVGESNINVSWREQYCGIWKKEYNGIIYYFIDNEYYFNRNILYGSFDDGERFAFFGKAVIELMLRESFIPDILHANDWQSATSVIYLRMAQKYIDKLRNIKVLFSIHNIEFQGKYDTKLYKDLFGFSDEIYSDIEFNNDINLLKGAIELSDKLITVSNRYSKEIQYEYYSFGLSGIIRNNQFKTVGITNGIDYDYYNAQTDNEINQNFSKENIELKEINKKHLCKLCGFENTDIPLIIMVSRLTEQKGIDLIMRVFDEMLTGRYFNFAVLGTGDKKYQDYFLGLKYRHSDNVNTVIGFDKSLSKKYFAGGDLLLMPSKSEPCGLTQMIASRYGTVPIVRETGGLSDTITPYNKYTGEGNGFSFSNYNAHDMMNIINYSIETYHNKKAFNRIVYSAMSTDYSWNNSAKKYLKLYGDILK